jgi:hypothetical protein
MVTIVEYSTDKHSVNAYPAKIVSPPFPSQCCRFSSEQLGGIQEEKGWPFVYQHCTVCGYTVRRFAPPSELLETIRTWRNSIRVGKKGGEE